MRTGWLAAAITCWGVLCSSAPAQNCQPFWAGAANPGSFTSICTHDDGSGQALYATGDYRFPAAWHGVARWNGQSWVFLHQGWPAHVPSFDCASARVFTLDFGAGPRLCAFIRANPNCTRLLKVWSGSAWMDAPPGLLLTNPLNLAQMLPLVSVNEATGPRIYAVRSDWPSGFSSVVRWNGTAWDSIGATTQGEVSILAEFDDGGGPALYAAGRFDSIGGVPAGGIARWKSSRWEPLGGGICAWHLPRDMIGHNDGSGPKLYVSDVTCAGGQPVNRIAKWDPATGLWSDVGGGGINTVGITEVYKLASFDDGRGRALYAGGYISRAGGLPMRQLARFDGTQWDDVGGGVGGGIPLDFAVFDDGRGPSLFVAGEFNRAGAGAAGSTPGLAQLVGCQGQCYVNCDNTAASPRVNVVDFVCFLNKYSRGDPYVDCNQDRALNVADFSCFLQRYAQGCL